MRLGPDTLTPIEMLVQEPDKRRIPALSRDQRPKVVQDVERVRPHVALDPARGGPGPRAARVARLHEARGGVEDAEGRGHRAVVEEGGGAGFVEGACERGDGVVVVCCKGGQWQEKGWEAR